jgi:hypothetical protein
MGHVGSSQEYDSIHLIFWFQHVHHHIDDYVHASNTCQWYIDAGHGPQEDTSVPFKGVAVALVSPWSIDIDGNIFDIQASTIIDIPTALSEVVCLKKTNLLNTFWIYSKTAGLHGIHDLSVWYLIKVVNSPAVHFNLCYNTMAYDWLLPQLKFCNPMQSVNACIAPSRIP